MLGALAAQAGQALQRALLYERQLRTAEVLQRGLLPQRLPAVPGIAMSARYAPGAAGLRVGGDWYDAIPVAGNRLALVVGDVMGKGVHAATRMSQIRNAVRVLAAVDPEPAVVAAGLDLLAGELAEDQIVTLVYLLLDPATGEGSHRPPRSPSAAARAATGQPRVLDGAGSPPLGVPGVRREQAPLCVEPGSLLVFFTDGLVEERRTGLDVGLPALTAAGRRLTDDGLDVEDFADALLELGAQDGTRPDDVCLLVVRRDAVSAPAPGEPLDAAVTLAAEPTSGAAARRFVQRTLAGVPADPERLDILVLLCSELVTNAVLHAAAPSADAAAAARRPGAPRGARRLVAGARASGAGPRRGQRAGDGARRRALRFLGCRGRRRAAGRGQDRVGGAGAARLGPGESERQANTSRTASSVAAGVNNARTWGEPGWSRMLQARRPVTGLADEGVSMALRLTPRDDRFYTMFEAAAKNLVVGATLLREQVESAIDDRPGLAARMRDVRARQRPDHARALQEDQLDLHHPVRPGGHLPAGARLDDVMDHLEAVGNLLYLLLTKLPSLPREMHELVNVLDQQAKLTADAMPRLKTMKDLEDYWIECNRLENDGDQAYRMLLAALFSGEYDALTVLKMKEVADELEAACDAFEHVANTVETIAVKES